MGFLILKKKAHSPVPVALLLSRPESEAPTWVVQPMLPMGCPMDEQHSESQETHI